MKFNLRTSNYAQAGKASADDMVRSFAAARRNAPDYGKMAQQAAEIRSKVKQEGINAAARVTKAGIDVAGQVEEHKIEQTAKRGLAKSKRKAGALAAAGQMFGTAGNYLGEKRTKREVGGEDAFFDGRIARNNEKIEQLRDQLEGFDNSPSSSGTPSQTGGETGSTNSDTTTDAGGATSSSNTSGGETSPDFQGFVDMASASGAKYPQLVAAQWALESGWGKSPSGKNNFFGIKATSGESGTSKQTWEVYDGQEVTETARFKNYDSPQGSVDDLVSKWHKNYGSYTGVNNASDAYAAADMLRAEGYATDPAYSEKLKKIMRDQGY